MKNFDEIGKENEVLFYYSNKPCCGKFGDKGGYSITIFANGMILCEEYEFGNNQSVSQEIKWIPKNDVELITNIFNKYAKEIESFEEKMFNCDDGNMYEFVFGSKVISGDNSIDHKQPVIWTIVDEIMQITNCVEKKYNIDPWENEPQEVYGPPSFIDEFDGDKEWDDLNEWPD